ncbi:MAG: hypothetical protein AAGK00_08220 [Pseudomonadota bacterium]
MNTGLEPKPHGLSVGNGGVDLIEDVDLATRVFRRGTRGLGDTCRLVLSLNGEELLLLDEEAGDRAPAHLVIDIRMPIAPGERLMAALAVRPWLHPNQPVIIFPTNNGAALGYLVRSPLISRVLGTITTELDLSDLSTETGHSALDATSHQR